MRRTSEVDEVYQGEVTRVSTTLGVRPETGT